MKSILYAVAALNLLPVTFSHAAGELAGTYQGKVWELSQWGAPCKVHMKYIYKYTQSYDAEVTFTSNENDGAKDEETIINVGFSKTDTEKLDAVFARSETTSYSFEHENGIWGPFADVGGSLSLENGNLSQVYFWTQLFHLPPKREVICGLLQKVE